jgi:hypothetical protein
MRSGYEEVMNQRAEIEKLRGEIASLTAALDAACKDAARVYTERDIARRTLTELRSMATQWRHQEDAGYFGDEVIRVLDRGKP